MNIIAKLKEKLKEKSVGYYISLAATVLSLIATIAYLAFGVSSHTFVGGIFTLILFAFLFGVVAIFYEGILSDFIPLVVVILISIAFVMLAADSIDDITTLFAALGDYFGTKENVGPRATVAVFMLLSFVTTSVGAFFRRTKKK